MKILDEIMSLAIESFNETVEPDHQIKNSDETIIFGPGSTLDSLGFVNFIVTIESEIDSKLNKTVFIVDEQALGMAENPFRTIGSLKNLLVEKLKAE
jgi:acyl carrier protein